MQNATEAEVRKPVNRCNIKLTCQGNLVQFPLEIGLISPNPCCRSSVPFTILDPEIDAPILAPPGF